MCSLSSRFYNTKLNLYIKPTITHFPEKFTLFTDLHSPSLSALRSFAPFSVVLMIIKAEPFARFESCTTGFHDLLHEAHFFYFIKRRNKKIEINSM